MRRAFRRTPIHDVFRPTRPVPHEDGYVSEVARASWDVLGGPIVQVHLTTTLPNRHRAWGLHQRTPIACLLSVACKIRFRWPARFSHLRLRERSHRQRDKSGTADSPAEPLPRLEKYRIERSAYHQHADLDVQLRLAGCARSAMGFRGGGPNYSVSFLSLAVDASPFFSVVLPTYGRGRFIKPSIESVLAQTFRDFELIVVGDGCADETEAVVRSFNSERVQWLNLATNSGSQSFPNNKGIDSSRGQWIAYIGHDDIWAPNHLDRVFQKACSMENADLVNSGCIFYGPEGSGDYYITGLFEQPDDALRHFCPPTSIAHRRDVTDRMGGWRDPRTVNCPADNEFLLRAAHAAMRFVSTGRSRCGLPRATATVYLRPSCDEQERLWQS